MIMSALYIRDLPKPVVDSLKRRAQLHHRSLQGELHAILHKAAERALPAEGFPPLKLTMSQNRGTKPWTREDFYDNVGR